MDGWNAVRGGEFDLVITDIDMPRMDGIELVTLIKRDPKLRSLPVMILSYKDRDEDRQRGIGGRRRLLPDQGQLPRRYAAAGGRRPDRRGRGMRIGIVNDLAMAAEALRRAVALAPEHQVVWVARDGAEAVELCARDTPDLVLMDLVMPVMDGVEATRRIMASTPCSILVVTVSVRTNAEHVFEAMGHGALDAIDTPSLGSGDPNAGAARLLAKIEKIGRFIHNGAKFRMARRQGRSAKLRRGTGGDRRVGRRPERAGDFARRTARLVSRGDRHHSARRRTVRRRHGEMARDDSPIPVRLAADGDRPQPGTALLAGTGDHLAFKASDRLGYVREPADYAYRPSVDVFFQSVGRFWPGRAVGVLLTGMGTDGAQGLKALRAKGHYTIAQDRATSAVYGMPKAAAALDAAVDILPLDRIARKLVDACTPSILRERTLP